MWCLQCIANNIWTLVGINKLENEINASPSDDKLQSYNENKKYIENNNTANLLTLLLIKILLGKGKFLCSLFNRHPLYRSIQPYIVAKKAFANATSITLL